MASLQEIVQSKDFRHGDRESQRGMLSSADPDGFGALAGPDQDSLLDRASGASAVENERDFGSAFARGFAGSKSHWAHSAANAVDLLSDDSDLEGWFNDRSEEWMKDSIAPENLSKWELAGQMLGQVAGDIPGYVLAGAAVGTGLAAAGLAAPWATMLAAPVAFGALGALGESDKGFVEAMKAGSVGAAFGALISVTGGLALPLRMSILGGVTYSMTPEDMDTDERIGHGLTMAILAALGGRHRPPSLGTPLLRKNMPKAPGQVGEFALEPEIAGKMRAEGEVVKTHHERAETVRSEERVAGEQERIAGETELEPLGVAREPVVDTALRDLSDKAFATRKRNAEREVDQLERAYDENPGRVDKEPAFRRELAKAQDKLTAVEIETFRRRVRKADAEELSDIMRSLGESRQDRVQMLVLLDEVRVRGIQKEIDPFLKKYAERSPDHAEILQGKLNKVRDLAKDAKRSEEVPSPRAVAEGKGDPDVAGAGGRDRPGSSPENPVTWKQAMELADPGAKVRAETTRTKGFGKKGEPTELDVGEGGARSKGGLDYDGFPVDPKGNRIHVSRDGDKVRSAYFDSDHGFMWLARKLGSLDVAGNAFERAHNLRGMPETLDGMVKWGHLAYVRDPRRPDQMMFRYEGKSMEEITMPIMGQGKKMIDNFGEYTHARQSEELIWQMIDPKDGKIRRATPEEVQQRVTREKVWDLERIARGKELGNPLFEGVYNNMKEFNNSVVDLGVKLDFFTRAQVNAWKRQEYAYSFHRQKALARDGKHRTVDSLAAALGVHKLHGGKREINDWFYNWMAGPQNTVRAIVQNKFIRDTIKQAEEVGGFVEELSPRHQRIVASMEQIKQAFEKELKDMDGLTDAQMKARMKSLAIGAGDIERLALFIGSSRPYGNDVVTFLENGKPRYYKVYDPVLYNAFAHLNRPGRDNMIVRALGPIKRLIQKATTLTPAFMAGNMVRDPAMATVMTRTGNQHLTASLRGLVETGRRSQEFRDLIANGLGGSPIRDSVPMTKRRLIRHAERQGAAGILNPKNLIYGINDTINILDALGRSIEMGPRVGEALRARDTGVFGKQGRPSTIGEAVFAGAEVSTDFRLRGTGEPTGVQSRLPNTEFGFTWGPEIASFMRQTVPFFSAMMNGADRGYRAVARDPHGKVAAGIKMSLIGASGVLLYGINRDLANKYGHLKDEDGRTMVDFLELPDWATTAYWHFYVPTSFDRETGEPTAFNHFHMPKIWEVGMLSSWGERFAESMHKGSEEDRDLLRDLMRITAQNFNINTNEGGIPFPIPAGLNVALEQFSNTVLFTGASILTPGMERLEPWRQARSGQSRTIQAFGEKMRDLGLGKSVISSPARAEALLRGLIGNWFSMGMTLSDVTLFPGGPAVGWDDVPVLSRFYSEAGKYDKNVEEFYKNLKTFNAAYATLREVAKSGDEELADKIQLDPDQYAMIEMGAPFDRANKKIQLYNREINMLRRGVAEPLATPAERHHMINRVTAERNAAMKEINIQAKRHQDDARQKARR